VTDAFTVEIDVGFFNYADIVELAHERFISEGLIRGHYTDSALPEDSCPGLGPGKSNRQSAVRNHEFSSPIIGRSS
jgi:hypothetical protein